VSGFRAIDKPGSSPEAGQTLLLEPGLIPVNGAAPAGIDLLGATLPRLAGRADDPIALIIDFASRLVVRNGSLSADAHLVAQTAPATNRSSPLEGSGLNP